MPRAVTSINIQMRRASDMKMFTSFPLGLSCDNIHEGYISATALLHRMFRGGEFSFGNSLEVWKLR